MRWSERGAQDMLYVRTTRCGCEDTDLFTTARLVAIPAWS